MAKSEKEVSKKPSYSKQERAEFVSKNLRVMFWMDKELLLEFDEICADKGIDRKEGIIKLITKFVEKNRK